MTRLPKLRFILASSLAEFRLMPTKRNQEAFMRAVQMIDQERRRVKA